MHDGCSGSSQSGKEIADKVRLMGYDKVPIVMPLKLDCTNCTSSFIMDTMVAQCPHCNMVYAVTPCHSHSAESVRPAGVNY
jgi:hypothetical protein